MKHVLEARRGKRVILSLLATSCLVIGSPTVVATAAKGGAQKPVSATHGDCKNDNRGKHKGYVCPSDNGGPTVIDTGSGTTDYNSGSGEEIIIIG